MTTSTLSRTNKILKWLLTITRIIIGWQFLYEGIAKIITKGWSSAPYLAGSKWILAPVFHWMAGNAAITGVVDFINIWGMILVGLGLMLGAFSRWASVGGALMLLFYFVAYPPVPGYMFGVPAEGSYLWINRNLIELFILVVFIFLSPDFQFGIDRLYSRWKFEKARKPIPEPSGDGAEIPFRREVIKNLVSIPALGAFAYAFYRKRKWDSFEEKLLKVQGIDANTGATLLKFNYSTLKDLKGLVPRGAISYTGRNGQKENFELSRLIMGGNLIGGWAHSRDLIYVSKLVKTYHTDEKVMQTLALGEKCGMNAIITNPQLGRVFQKYKHEFGGKMKFISDCGIALDFQKGIAMSLAVDADALYCQGEITDRWTDEKWDDPQKRTQPQRMELIKKGLEEIRSHGKPAGIGAHRIEAVKRCVEYGLKPDFWVKTCHSHNYWSAQMNAPWHDNLFDFDPEETIKFMGTLEEPWIAFKVLAAGAITPDVGLPYAYSNGADFVCLGMYDFQIVEDVNIALDAFSKSQVRTRPWRG
ncbi:MAG TPA: DoxX family protein [Bacteroidales bacterium]|nr:DoxX family protein [Bacteroidales bacterium]